MEIMRNAIKARSHPHLPPRVVLLSIFSKVTAQNCKQCLSWDCEHAPKVISLPLVGMIVYMLFAGGPIINQRME